MAVPTKAEAQAARDKQTKLIGASAKKVSGLAQPALDALPVLEAYAKSKLTVTPPVEQDSPDGYTVVPGGQTITLGGVRWRIGTDEKIYRNDVVEATSDQVVQLVNDDGQLKQKNAKGDWWTQPLSGGAGVKTTDPTGPVVVDPPGDPPADPGAQPDSVVGTVVTGPGPSLWLNGVEVKINADRTVGVGRTISAKSGNAQAVSLRQFSDGSRRIEQKAVWAAGAPNGRGTYTVPLDASQGELLNQDDLWSDEEVVLPPVATPDQLPDGFKTFEGQVIPTSSQSDSWSGKYAYVASDWWVHQFEFSKENVVVVGKDLELRQRASKSGEVAWTKSLIGAGFYQVAGTLQHLVIGVVYCLMFLYAQSASEIDSEIVYDPATGTWRREYRIHAPGGGEVFFKRDTLDPAGFHIEGMKYVPGQYIEWYVDGELRCRATPADVPAGTFPGETMELLADCWGGSWTGGYDGSDATLTLHGSKIEAL